MRTSGSAHQGLSLLIIEADLPGVTVRKLDATGWWSGNTTLVTFDDVKVRADNLIGQEGMGFMMMATVMNGERLIGIVGASRAARACLAEAIKYARQRKTFGKRLIDHQVIRHKIIHMARKVEAVQAFLEQISFQIQNGASVKEIGTLAALGKVEATQALEFCAREASQILGGNSFVRGGKGEIVERIAREVRVQVVGGGSEEVLIDLAARMSKL